MSAKDVKEKAIKLLAGTVEICKTKIFTNSNKKNSINFFMDLKTSLFNVVLGTKLPDRKDWGSFVFHQIIINGSGWTAGVLASDLVGSYFKTKSAKNLWGLKGRHDGKTMISKDDFEMYSWWASYIFGLIILILVRHIVIQTIEEFKKIRTNKEQNLSNN